MNQTLLRAKALTLALVGNPNCGKTTLYNALTGSNQLVGNWSGVTVQAKRGSFCYGQQHYHLIDLPGIYSLVTHEDASNDEKATWEYLQQDNFDAILYILDAHHFERSLYLALQCLELGKPMIIALNRTDMAQRDGLTICPLKLSQLLHCPVVPICARQNAGLSALLAQTKQLKYVAPSHPGYYFPTVIKSLYRSVKEHDPELGFFEFICQLETDKPIPHVDIFEARHELASKVEHDLDIYIASCRYQFIDAIVGKVCQRAQPARSFGLAAMSMSLDKWVCHRLLGVPIFLFMMYLLFFFAINIGGIFQPGIEILFEGFLVDGLGDLLAGWSTPTWLQTVLTLGLGKGITTVFTFVPVLAAMFFALALLQDSGYMSRAAFVVDRVMRSIGLPGKSFVPMIVGFGCNVPAILGTRALDHRRERILTVMMSPFMSCGARLAIFTVFVSVFFPHGGENIIFLLYMVGILMAILTGLILKNTLLQGAPTPFLLDMPDYQLPHLPNLCRQAYFKTKKFVKDALKLVVPVCMLLSALNHMPVGDQHDTRSTTALEQIGKSITPVFKPMGIDEDNWPATVGLFTGVMAKEVVIGSLNTLYATPTGGEPDSNQDETQFQLSAVMQQALQAVWEQVQQLGRALNNPIAAKAPTQVIDMAVSGEMLHKFASQAAAFAYLLFILLYVPCVSVMAAMKREVNIRWTLFSGFWTTLLAYSTSVIYFQCVTFYLHPQSSFMWVVGLSMGILLFILVIRRYSRSKLTHLPTHIHVQT